MAHFIIHGILKLTETDENTGKVLVNAVRADERDVKMGTNSWNVEVKPVAILDAANYMILQFYRIDKPYTCGRTKICKLLTILSFKYARNKQQIFDTSIYEYNGCGCIIPEVLAAYERDIRLHLCYTDDKRYISDTLKDITEIDIKVQNKYAVSGMLDETLKNEIEIVFRRFGAYSTQDLGKYINQIINQPDIVQANKQINMQGIAELNRAELKEIDTDMLLLDYLFQK